MTCEQRNAAADRAIEALLASCRTDGISTRELRNRAAHRAVEAMRVDPKIAALLDDPARARAAHKFRVGVAEAVREVAT